MSRFLSKAKVLHNGIHLFAGEWIEGYYEYSPISEKHYIHYYEEDEFENVIAKGRIMVDGDTICQCAKSNKRGKLWEGDYFWDDRESGVIGVIRWRDDYDGFVVDLVPNIVEGQTVPDFSDMLEVLRLDDYSSDNYVYIFNDFIGNIHDIKER